uniref:Uncharacterized protein n=1 Tax=Panagrolaimus sp. ES5 TaxID=591445 RepID=A0AC34FRD0_9BILA
MNYCFKIVLIFGILSAQLLFFDSILAAKLQRKNENASNDSSLILGDESDEQNPLFSDELFADGKAEGIPDGNHLILRGNGEINLTLSGGNLQFEVCPDCKALSSVCFDATENSIDSKVACSGFPSYCNFQVKYDTDTYGNEGIYFGAAFVDFVGSCLRPTMHRGKVHLVRTINILSCEPNIIDNMIKLYVNIHSSCSIKVLNAKVHVPVPPSTPLPPSASSNTTDPSWTASFPWWLILIIVIVVVAVILGIVGFVYHRFFKKRHSSNIPPPTEVVPKPTVTNAPVATLETPSKRKHDLNFTQFEPSKKSKKTQKKKDKKKKKQQTTQEPTTTNEDAQAPHVIVPPAPVQPNPTPFIPYQKRIIPRSLKSVKTDSLDETTKSDKLAMVESPSVSFHHHCVKPAVPDLLEEMNENYPGNTHVVVKSEVDLLCSPVSKMFSSINELAQEYQQKLTAVGCEFDQNGCITSMTDGARQYIHDKNTPASIAYFAFGAEYYEYVTDDPELLPKFSIPLLMVIAFQPRFPTVNRRKACSLLRRKLPIILGNFTAVQRQTLSFPINIIEEAYCRDPKYFKNVAGIQTDSEGERKMKNENAAGEKKERKAGDGKRKSSKKRH